MYAQLRMVRGDKLRAIFRWGPARRHDDARRRSLALGSAPRPTARWTPALFRPTGFLLRRFVLAILILLQIAGWEETE